MSSRSPGFRSIFNKLDNTSERKSIAGKTISDALDWSISDCSSNSAEEQENQNSPLRISGYSSDESGIIYNDSYVRNSTISVCSTSFTDSTTKKRYRRQLRPRARLQINRTPKYGNSSIARFTKVLAVSNHNTSEDDKISPWNKVRSVFQTLKQSSSHRDSNITDKALEQNSGKVPVEKLVQEQIEWSVSSSDDETSSSQKYSQMISTPSSSSQASNAPTELDLLVALIEREEQQRSKKLATKQASKKRFRKEGYLHELQRTLEAAKTDRKFLEHDKRFGLQSGVRLLVLELENSFGVHMATAKMVEVEDTQVFRILLDAELAMKVKVGSSLEAFFKSSIEPYTSKGRKEGELLSTYLQPHRLLLL